MKLVDIILQEYTEEEKRRMGIPAGAVSRGGKWYVGDKYVGRVKNKKFVPSTVADVPPTTDAGTSVAGRDTTAPKRASDDTSTDVQVVSAPTKPNPSFDELRSEARKHQYTVMTTAPLGTIHSTSPVGEMNAVGKPNGFWFGVGAEWVDWTAEEMPQWKGDNLYSVEVDETQCLVIETETDLRLFHAEYRTPDGMINWEKVAKKYKGIISKQYIASARRKYPWYYGWDIASGCIWDTSALKQVKQISIT